MAEHESELLRRWQEGEHAAFESIVRRWQQPMARFLARMLGNDDGIADLCQEVFLRVYLNRSRYDERGTFSTWLYRIALNIARDSARRRKRLLFPLPAEVAANSRSAESNWEQRELHEAVVAALAELPEPHREVLVLRHHEDMNFEEMSRLLDVPASTLKSRFAVALRRMQERLQSFA